LILALIDDISIMIGVIFPQQTKSNSLPLSFGITLYLILSTIALASEVADKEFNKISRSGYTESLQGFWLGQNIGNWTGLITEMDKVGTPETLPFYTDDDWAGQDLPAYWGEGVPHTKTIDFYFEKSGVPWGSDDDTDIEYMYAHLLDYHKTSKLSAEQIRQGWLKHIYSEDDAPLFQKFPSSNPQKENFLWVSNEQARKLMVLGMTPPHTSEPKNNTKYMMIDAQLTTEIFGLLAPTRPDIALDISYLPIRTVAKNDSAWISQFYIVMHSLASTTDSSRSFADQTQSLADIASGFLPSGSTPAKIYAYVLDHYLNNPDKENWELTRDAVYKRYQLGRNDSYSYTQPFDANINFAASLISLFYGQGDILKTIKIGTLVGWDSDNPTATWGGLLGFMYGLEGVLNAFQQSDISDTYWIHRTRRNFPDKTPSKQGEDNFQSMAQREIRTIDRIVIELMDGRLTQNKDYWLIPKLVEKTP
jgi:hypothetical protein